MGEELHDELERRQREKVHEVALETVQAMGAAQKLQGTLGQVPGVHNGSAVGSEGGEGVAAMLQPAPVELRRGGCG